MVKKLLELIKLLKEEDGHDDNRRLTDADVKKLIRAFAQGRWSPKLKHVGGSFTSAFSGKRLRTTGGFHRDVSQLGALYVHPELMLNDDPDVSMRERIEDVLHEIQHYNQRMSWDNDMSFRSEFVKSKKLPPSITDDPIALYETSWDDICTFWERRYGYWDAPHEADAREFASSNVDAAITMLSK
jgi:hypothetical protein